MDFRLVLFPQEALSLLLEIASLCTESEAKDALAARRFIGFDDELKLVEEAQAAYLGKCIQSEGKLHHKNNTIIN